MSGWKKGIMRRLSKTVLILLVMALALPLMAICVVRMQDAYLQGYLHELQTEPTLQQTDAIEKRLEQDIISAEHKPGIIEILEKERLNAKGWYKR